MKKNSPLILRAVCGLSLAVAAAAQDAKVVPPVGGPVAAAPAAPTLAGLDLSSPGLPVSPALAISAVLSAPEAIAAAAPARTLVDEKLEGVAQSLAKMPDAGKADAGSVSQGGARLSDAVSGSRSIPPSAGDPLEGDIREASQVVAKLRAEIARVIVGQAEMIDAVIMGMIAGEHILLEGVPGVAKTQAVKAFSDAVQAQFQRIQGTPDKLPSDIIGAEILQENPANGVKEMRLELGPIFANILLVDEINRMMPKTQAALLQGMQEGVATVGRQTLALPRPFMVLATQNPIEQEGTYRLPEAQQDRFMLKVIVRRPSKRELIEIMERFSTQQTPKARRVATLEELMNARALAEKVRVAPELKEYITDLVEATHNPARYKMDFKDSIENGASPRAAIFLLKGAQIRAFMSGRAYANDEDVRAVAPLVLGHRLTLSFKAGDISAAQFIEQILKTVRVPKP